VLAKGIGASVRDNYHISRSKAIRGVLAVVAAAGVAACSWPQWATEWTPEWAKVSLPEMPSMSVLGDEPDRGPVISCDAATRLNLRAMDWDGAKRLDVHIRNELFTPATMVMAMNTPNVVTVFNDDTDTRTFGAKEFFRTAAIARIVYDGREVAENCIEGIRIGPAKWAELHLVPLRQGEFTYGEGSGGPPPRPPFATRGEIGRITVR